VLSGYAAVFVFLFYTSEIRYMTVHKEDVAALDRAYAIARNSAFITAIACPIFAICLCHIVKEFQNYHAQRRSRK
jgi:cytochrome bd-type quinol oxidase subunit 2